MARMCAAAATQVGRTGSCLQSKPSGWRLLGPAVRAAHPIAPSHLPTLCPPNQPQLAGGFVIVNPFQPLVDELGAYVTLKKVTAVAANPGVCNWRFARAGNVSSFTSAGCAWACAPHDHRCRNHPPPDPVPPPHTSPQACLLPLPPRAYPPALPSISPPPPLVHPPSPSGMVGTARSRCSRSATPPTSATEGLASPRRCSMPGALACSGYRRLAGWLVDETCRGAWGVAGRGAGQQGTAHLGRCWTSHPPHSHPPTHPPTLGAMQAVLNSGEGGVSLHLQSAAACPNGVADVYSASAFFMASSVDTQARRRRRRRRPCRRSLNALSCCGQAGSSCQALLPRLCAEVGGVGQPVDI